VHTCALIICEGRAPTDLPDTHINMRVLTSDQPTHYPGLWQFDMSGLTGKGFERLTDTAACHAVAVGWPSVTSTLGCVL
jgi:hypothetical protein